MKVLFLPVVKVSFHCNLFVLLLLLLLDSDTVNMMGAYVLILNNKWNTQGTDRNILKGPLKILKESSTTLLIWNLTSCLYRVHCSWEWWFVILKIISFHTLLSVFFCNLNILAWACCEQWAFALWTPSNFFLWTVLGAIFWIMVFQVITEEMVSKVVTNISLKNSSVYRESNSFVLILCWQNLVLFLLCNLNSS